MTAFPESTSPAAESVTLHLASDHSSRRRALWATRTRTMNGRAISAGRRKGTTKKRKIATAAITSAAARMILFLGMIKAGKDNIHLLSEKQIKKQ